MSDMNQQIHIVSPMILQNKLLADYVERETGFDCLCHHNPLQSPVLNPDQDPRPLILWDCVHPDIDAVWMKPVVDCYLALFNVKPDKGIELEAIRRDVRGIFFEHDSLSHIIEGIHTIIRGELWYSRKTLNSFIFQTRNLRSSQQTQYLLTIREREILIMLSSGTSNHDIAGDLNISTNTVRTHLYNIYQKINVNSRLQAAFWASRNL